MITAQDMQVVPTFAMLSVCVAVAVAMAVAAMLMTLAPVSGPVLPPLRVHVARRFRFATAFATAFATLLAMYKTPQAQAQATRMALASVTQEACCPTQTLGPASAPARRHCHDRPPELSCKPRNERHHAGCMVPGPSRIWNVCAVKAPSKVHDMNDTC